MKKIILVVLLFAGVVAMAQTGDDAKTLHETAKSFMRQGDWENAALVINKAVDKDPKNLEMLKDQSFIYYMQKDYAKSMAVGKVITERDDSDPQCFQILGLSYKAIAEVKECKKMFERGLKKFPTSGVLHYEYGELLGSDEKTASDALPQFEAGIKSDANYPGNYYYAAKLYMERGNRIWGILYAETFLNLESYTGRATEIKNLLLEQYKKMYAENDLVKTFVSAKNPNLFAKAVAETFAKQSSIAANGITTEALLAIRTRFILDWNEKHAAAFPFRLFEHHQQLLKEGLFEAYNQWLFGAASGAATYQNWLLLHPEENEAFQKFQRNRVFKVPQGQYYQN